MAENKMEKVAQLLGLELEEEFGIKGTSNRYKFTKNGLMWTQDDLIEWYPSVNINELILGKYKIIKLHKPILDDAEREYLGNIIKPFRDRILWIKKASSHTLNHEYIKICYQHNNYNVVLAFPDFKVGRMYKGMELDKAYTLKELGL